MAPKTWAKMGLNHTTVTGLVVFPARQLVEVVDVVVLNTNKCHTSLVLSFDQKPPANRLPMANRVSHNLILSCPD